AELRQQAAQVGGFGDLRRDLDETRQQADAVRQQVEDVGRAFAEKTAAAWKDADALRQSVEAASAAVRASREGAGGLAADAARAGAELDNVGSRWGALRAEFVALEPQARHALDRLRAAVQEARA